MRQVQLTDQELQSLANFIDAGVRQLGAQCVHDASHLLRKLETAEEVPPPMSIPSTKSEAG